MTLITTTSDHCPVHTYTYPPWANSSYSRRISTNRPILKMAMASQQRRTNGLGGSSTSSVSYRPISQIIEPNETHHQSQFTFPPRLGEFTGTSIRTPVQERPFNTFANGQNLNGTANPWGSDGGIWSSGLRPISRDNSRPIKGMPQQKAAILHRDTDLFSRYFVANYRIIRSGGADRIESSLELLAV